MSAVLVCAFFSCGGVHTGKPKGVVHCTGGYMVYAHTTTKYVFNMSPGDIYWCTADCGWITGHTYLTYGPLLVGATNVVFEGVPTYPGPDRCWQVVDKYQVGTVGGVREWGHR